MTAVLPEEVTTPGPSPSGGLRRSPFGPRRRRRLLPVALLVPALGALGVGLAYPLYRLAIMSTQDYGLRQQFGQPPESVGLDNFGDILGDSYFWEVLRRSLVFCLVTVALTMLLGTLTALLLGRLGRGMRTALSVSLLFAWATPALTATVVWQWIFDTRSGVAKRGCKRLMSLRKKSSTLLPRASFFSASALAAGSVPTTRSVKSILKVSLGSMIFGSGAPPSE